MAPLIVLVVSFVLFQLLGLVIPYFEDTQIALRAALGLMFIVTASAHWGSRRPDLVRMVPSRFGNAGIWVSLTGLAELAIAAGLQVPRFAVWAGASAIFLLICLFSANMKAAREGLTILRKPVLPLGPRLALQLLFIVVLLISILPWQPHAGRH